jgi:hypothetical protein
VPVAEDVERQVAVAVVVAVEEPPFLVAVQRVVGGVEIDHDLFGRSLTGLFRCTQPWPAISRKVSVDITGQDHRRDFVLELLLRLAVTSSPLNPFGRL